MRTRLPLFHLAVIAWAIASSCSSGGLGGGCGSCGGAACLAPLPGGFTGQRFDNVVTVRVTEGGFTALNANWQQLLPSLGVVNPIAVPVPCSNVSFGSGGHLCDQNLNGSCDPGEQCDVGVTLTGLTLEPATAPVDTGILTASAKLQIKTGRMWLNTCGVSLFGACICRLKCAADFDSARSGSPVDDFSADVRFTLDTRFNRLLAFDVQNVNGINTLESGDLDLVSQGVCSGLACGVLDLGFIKSFLVDQFVKPQLTAQVRDQVDKARCRACGAMLPTCPAPSTCQAGVCKDSAGACAPTLLGVEGRLELGALLASVGDATGQADLLTAAGGAVSSQAGQHLTFGVEGGVDPVAVSSCVPAAPAPAAVPIPAPDFTVGPAGHHVALGLSEQFLNRLGWATQQAGALCLDVTHAQVPFLSTGLFKTFLPSLGVLVPQDSPMMLVLRPRLAPHFTVGSGKLSAGNVPLEPLLTLALDELGLELYALIDDRYARLFTINADVKVPLSLVPQGCDTLTPVLGDTAMLFTVKGVADSELLAEDPQALKDLLPLLLNTAAPALTKGLPAFTLPTLGGFKLKVSALQGINPRAQGGFEHLGLFAQLLPPNATCAVEAPAFTAALQGVELPDQVRATGGGLVAPEVTLKVASASGRPIEVGYRLDGNGWHGFRAPQADGTLRVRDAALLLQGHHALELRARFTDAPQGIGAGPTLGVTIDLEAPTLQLEADRAHGRLLVHAHDQVTADAQLAFSFKVGDGAWSEAGPLRLVELQAVEAAGGLGVRVRDEAGREREARWAVARVATREAAATSSAAPGTAGCSAAPVGLTCSAVALAGLARRRSRRRG